MLVYVTVRIRAHWMFAKTGGVCRKVWPLVRSPLSNFLPIFYRFSTNTLHERKCAAFPAYHRARRGRRRVACPQAVHYVDQETRGHALAAGRVEGDDAELKDIYNRLSGSDFDAEVKQQGAALKDMLEPLLGAEIDTDQTGLGNLSAN